jgi:hypothetical protein
VAAKCLCHKPFLAVYQAGRQREMDLKFSRTNSASLCNALQNPAASCGFLSGKEKNAHLVEAALLKSSTRPQEAGHEHLR